MTIAHLFQDFGDATAQQFVLSDEALEEQRLISFENGYQAGWEDAAKAIAQEQGQITADLAQNLRDMAFTFQEAHSAVQTALTPLLTATLTKLLPTAAHASLVSHAVTQLTALSHELGGGTCIVTASPAQADWIASMLPDVAGLSVSVQPDPSLTDGQAFLRLGTRERMIDLDATVAEIADVFRGFFASQMEVMKHG